MFIVIFVFISLDRFLYHHTFCGFPKKICSFNLKNVIRLRPKENVRFQLERERTISTWKRTYHFNLKENVRFNLKENVRFQLEKDNPFEAERERSISIWNRTFHFNLKENVHYQFETERSFSIWKRTSWFIINLKENVRFHFEKNVGYQVEKERSVSNSNNKSFSSWNRCSQSTFLHFLRSAQWDNPIKTVT